MRVGIRTKQVAGVTAVVGLAAAVLFAWYVSSLAHILLEEQPIERAVCSPRRSTSARSPSWRAAAIRSRRSQADDGLRTILESTAYSEGVEYAAIVDPAGRIIADADPARVGTTLGPKSSLDDLIDTQGPMAQLRAIYTPGGRTLEVRQPLAVGGGDLGSIRVGVSTLLLRSQLVAQLFGRRSLGGRGRAGGLGAASRCCSRSSCSVRFTSSAADSRVWAAASSDVNVDLPADAELADLGDSFKQVSARLAADRTELAGQRALESVVDHLEDAVALFAPDGTLLFSNAAMDASLGRPTAPAARRRDDAGAAPTLTALWADGPSVSRRRRTRARGRRRRTRPRRCRRFPTQGERLVLTHLVPGAGRRAARRHARVAQPRLPQPGRIDAQLLAQARRPQPADGGHRARDQESAQRDDDPSRAAEDAGGRSARGAAERGGDCRPGAPAR